MLVTPVVVGVGYDNHVTRAYCATYVVCAGRNLVELRVKLSHKQKHSAADH